MIAVISTSNTLTSLIQQVAANPNAARTQPVQVNPFNTEAKQGLNQTSGFAGVRRHVSEDRFMGSGIALELALSSGQNISLTIEKGVSGAVRNINFETSGLLNPEDEEKIKQFFTQLSESIDTLFSQQESDSNLFDFVNMQGIKDVELSVQKNKGNLQQRLEFEKQVNGNGRKEVSGEWSRYDRLDGSREQHNFALSKQSKDIAAAYGQMDYQWVVEQVTAGMAILGNPYTGDQATQLQVSNFFVSATHALFDNAQKGYELFQHLGASSLDSKAFVGKAIRALSPSSDVSQTMPGSAVQQGSDGAQSMNGLDDFKADFASKRQSGGMNNSGGYKLSMAISQVSRSIQGSSDDKDSQTQFRRLLLEYESKGEKQSYDYRWKHDEALINRFINGVLDKGYFKVSDIQQGILNNQSGQREELASYMQRNEYRAEDNNKPAAQHGYIKPERYREHSHRVNYTV
ncbi:hypothetical protein [Bermanella sp. R86510]|uniref:hypothetical protein n=1 Tax=unclassified Bermanella TaxID=2627862 RepID=UPI0037C7CDCA